MRRMLQLLALSLFGFVMVSALSFGQEQTSREWKYRAEVFGSFGSGRFYHGDEHLGNGLDLGAGFGIRPFSGALRGLGFEVMYNGLNFSNDWGNGYQYKGDMRLVSGNALYHFGRSRMQFYVVGGIGALKADYTYRNPYTNSILNDPGYVEAHGDTKMAVNFGAGLKARIISGLAVRPEIRFYDTTIGTGYNWSHLRLSVGLGYHF